MVKIHNVRMIIENQSGFSMQYSSDWFDSGRLADTYSWPETVADGGKLDILCYEKDWSLAGCSGTVAYKMDDTEVTFAFSNPAVGKNKLGVGTSGRAVWDNMTNHDYSPFEVDILLGDTTLKCECQCTGGTTNLATVKLIRVESEKPTD